MKHLKTFLPIPCRTGQLLLLTGFPSLCNNPRNVNVWLPPDYSELNNQGFPVIYAHDGQNLFDPASSFIGVDWGLDETLARLTADEGLSPAIIVGIWNTPARSQEFLPQRVFEQWLSCEEQAECLAEVGPPLSDSYLQLIVEELKPLIDFHFNTRHDYKNTFMMGSSRGGLISAYAVCEYPDVFGAAACLSTHWPACRGKMADYLSDQLPDHAQHRFYFDYGTETLDALYEPYQLLVDEVMREKSFKEGETWLTRKFSGEEHSERAWRQRVDIPLRFLLADR